MSGTFSTFDDRPADANAADAIPRLALRPKEAARALGIGETLLWSLRASGEIPCVKVGRTVLFPVDELRRWLSEQASKSST